MRYGRYGLSYVVLRIGVGIVFLWIGIDILRHSDLWLGFVPESLPFGIPRAVALQLNGFFDILLGILLLVRIFPKTAAAFAVLHLAGILLTQGVNAILIRDVGLLGAALALLRWPSSPRGRGWHLFPKSYASRDE
ncbi:MAG: hypothetical protein AAB538_01360, partial [Patescibacteria group bacterium]